MNANTSDASVYVCLQGNRLQPRTWQCLAQGVLLLVMLTVLGSIGFAQTQVRTGLVPLVTNTQPQIRIVAPINVVAGEAKQLSVTVSGTTNRAVQWTAALGSINAKGVYIAPFVADGTPDTVTAISKATPTVYASATITVTSTTTQSSTMWSLSSQPPVTEVPYATSLFAKPLPASVLSHLAPNSDAIAQCALSNCGSLSNSSYGQTTFATPGLSDIQVPHYYATATDPAYRVTTCSHPPMSGHDPRGMVFHIPNNAQFGRGSSDEFLTVWDQSQGKVLELYVSGQAGLTVGSCTSTSVTQPCSLPAVMYCGYDTYTDSGAYQVNNAGNSLGSAPWALELRSQELIQGSISHPLYLLAACTTGSYVFPSYGPTSRCSNTSNRPAQGALVVLDYTSAQISAMNIPSWQKAILRTLSTYGGYIGDMGGAGTAGGLAIRGESGQAYSYAHIAWPLTTFATANGIACQKGGTAGECRYVFNWAANVPLVNNKGILGHIHIADPCIAKGLAGVAGGCF